MASALALNLTGLHTYYNQLGQVPPGSLAVASNVVIDANGSIQSRRGVYAVAEKVGLTSSRINALTSFQNQIIAQYDSASLAYRVPGTGWTAYSGNFAPVDVNLARTRFIQANSNLYFTTNTGVQKLDAYNNPTPVLAGMYPGLDIQASLANDGSGFMGNNPVETTTGNISASSATISSIANMGSIAIGQYISGAGIPANTTVLTVNTAGSSITISQNATATTPGVTLTFYVGSLCAYRMIWGIKDANTNLVLGAPSQRAVVANTSADTSDVNVTFSIPTGITVNHFFQVYRSLVTVSASTEPDDELQLVYEGNPTSGQITAGTITILDNTPDDLRGATIYTASYQGGILQSNYRPPLAADIAFYKNSVFYANTVSNQNLSLTLLAAGAGSGINCVQTTGDTSSSSTSVTNLASTSYIVAGQSVSGTGIPAATTVSSISGTTVTLSQAATATGTGVTLTFYDTITVAGVTYSAGLTENVSTNTFAVASSGSTAQNITDTANSLIRVINRSTSNTTIYAYYLSGYTDLPGMMQLQSRGVGASVFSVTASSHGGAFNPALPTSGTSVSSQADTYKNALYVSKLNQPEAVPLTNQFFVGSAAFPIQRIVPLRDSLFIFKEDGIYRLIGQDPSSYYIDIFDTTSQLLAPESAVSLNNMIYCFTNQGVAAVSDTGIQILSRPIEGDLLQLLGTNPNGVQYKTFGISYQSDRKYILGTVSNSTDNQATQIYVYNYFTDAWTNWPLTKNCGIVNIADNLLYLGDGLSNTLTVERKNFTYTDYVDDANPATIAAVSGAAVTLSSVSGVNVGDLLYQSDEVNSPIASVNPSTNQVVLANPITMSTGSATVFTSIPCTIQFNPITAGTSTTSAGVGGEPQQIKQFSQIELFFKRASFFLATLSYYTDLVPSVTYTDLAYSQIGLWGEVPWGESPWGGVELPRAIRTYIPKFIQRCSELNVGFIHRVAYGDFVLNGVALSVRSLSDRVTK
jgi:hypothetical protein